MIMKKNKNYPSVFIKKDDWDTSNMIDVTKNSQSICLEEDYILWLLQLSKKQLDLYIFRHKDEIKTYKDKSKKYISINILSFVWKEIARLNKSK